MKLQSKNSAESVVFLNTHFDHKSEIALVQSADLIRKWAGDIVEKYPVIVVGDFNADKNSAAYDRLTRDGMFYDVYRKRCPDGSDEETYHGYGKPGVLAAIDWILASKHLETLQVEIDKFSVRGLYPSDHYPLTAVLRFRGDEIRC